MTNSEQPTLSEEIDKRIEEALSILKRYDPRDLISRIAIQHATDDVDNFEDSLRSNQITYVEYAQSLALAREFGASRQPAPGPVADDFAWLISDIFALVLRFVSNQPLLDEKDHIRFASLLSYLTVRGSSYEQHFFGLLRGLFGNHAPLLESHYGLNVETVISSFRSLVAQVNDNLQRYQDIIQEKASQIRYSYDQYVRENLAHFTDTEALNREWETIPEVQSKIEELGELAREFRSDVFELEPTEELSENFLRLFSASFGENTSFLAFDKSPGWPGNDTIVERKPFIRHEGKYYCFAPPVFSHFAVDAIEDLIRQADSNYFNGAYERQRASYLENATLEYFASLLPGAQIYEKLYYRIQEGTTQKRVETDGIVLFDNNMFIIEAKAGSLTVPARRGSLKRIGRDAGKLVEKAYNQATRTQRYIAGSQRPEFEHENGSTALVIEDKSRYENVYLVNVTLADLKHLSAQLSSLKSLNLLQGEVWPWSVYINDLRVISEIIESPSAFLLFLQQRIKANNHGKFRVLSELELLMFFLREGGIDLTPEFHEDYDYLVISDYTDALDRYYDHIAGFLPTGEKPSLNIPIEIEKLISGLEALGKYKFTKVTTTLLRIDRETQEQISNHLETIKQQSTHDGKDHDVTMAFSELDVGMTFLVRGKTTTASWGELERKFRIALQDHRVSEWILVATNPASDGEDTYDLRFYEAPRNGIDNKKVGRNDLCPCGSGLKYKKCCGKL